MVSECLSSQVSLPAHAPNGFRNTPRSGMKRISNSVLGAGWTLAAGCVPQKSPTEARPILTRPGTEILDSEMGRQTHAQFSHHAPAFERSGTLSLCLAGHLFGVSSSHAQNSWCGMGWLFWDRPLWPCVGKPHTAYMESALPGVSHQCTAAALRRMAELRRSREIWLWGTGISDLERAGIWQRTVCLRNPWLWLWLSLQDGTQGPIPGNFVAESRAKLMRSSLPHTCPQASGHSDL